MADIRIKDLATTATTSASDDYLALDGSTNGTRKILATNVANNVTDVVFGASGPSAKSSIAARAARQGLVFDGTAGATVTGIPAFGTGDFTISAWVNQSAAKTAAITDANSESALFRIVSDGSVRWYEDGVLKLNLLSVISYGKMILLTLTRTGGVTTLYKDGIVNGSASYAATSCTNGISCIGRAIAGATSEVFNGSLSVQVYNRALSAAEVVSLYEAGVPAGADYNTASNTGIVTGAWSTYNGSGSVTSTAVDNFDISASGAYNVQCGSVFNVSIGQRIRINGSFSSLTGSPSVYLYKDSVGAFSSSVTLTSTGAELVATATVTGVKIFIGTSGAGTAIGSSVSITRLGLLLAPDAAQSGGGLTWYDTSGNAANITLPATGVTWNVPTSGFIQSPSTLKLNPASGNVLIGTTTDISGTGGLHVAGTGTATSSSNGGALRVGTNVAMSGNAGGASYFGGTLQAANIVSTTATGTTLVQISDTAAGGKAYSLISAGTGNVHGAAAGTFYLRNSSDNTTIWSLTSTGAATFAGAVAIGNIVNTVSPTSPNRTVTMVIGGVTYYLAAKTTND